MIDLAGLPPRNSLVAIVGPTGSGKTALAARLARDFSLEVVSADSRQVYRCMDIGTAKPTAAERQAVRHHLIDVVDPDQPFTLADYQLAANAAIRDIQSRGVLPVLVGGTGLYVRSVTEGLCIPHAPPDPALRAELQAKTDQLGVAWLEGQVRAFDPQTADRERANPRRLIRAMEVYRATGRPPSSSRSSVKPGFRVHWIGLTMARRDLHDRVDRRIDAMIEAGLVEETVRLQSRGYAWDLPSMSGLGYRQIGQYLRGESDLATAIQRTKHATHAFIRHQYAWFRLNDPRIHWIDAGSGVSSPDAL